MIDYLWRLHVAIEVICCDWAGVEVKWTRLRHDVLKHGLWKSILSITGSLWHCRSWHFRWLQSKLCLVTSSFSGKYHRCVSFDVELSKSGNCAFWLSEVSLYSRTPSKLRWPVLSMMSCSSTFAWYNLVAVVARSEWLLQNPEIPASLHNLATVPWRRLWPIGFVVNQHPSLG